MVIYPVTCPQCKHRHNLELEVSSIGFSISDVARLQDLIEQYGCQRDINAWNRVKQQSKKVIKNNKRSLR